MITFYEWLQTTEHEKPERKLLAAELKEVAEKHPEVKKIDSFHDFVSASHWLKGRAYYVVGDGIWCNYCAASGHPINS